MNEYGLICPVCDQTEFEDEDEYFEHCCNCFFEEERFNKEEEE